MTLVHRLCIFCFLGFLPATGFAALASPLPDIVAATSNDVVESPHVMPGQADPVTGITVPESIGIHAVDEFYPKLALRHREQGTIKLKFVVTPEGTVVDPIVVDSSGFADLDAAATEAVKTWRYKPAQKDGVPIAVKLGATVQFRIQVYVPQAATAESATTVPPKP